MLVCTAAVAGPQGGEVVGGAGTISNPDVLTTVIGQQSQNLAIDWTSFNIGANETVQFIQPDASAIALNRVVGGDVSSILGRIDANGNVFLVNPRGVVFGESAQVSVGSLMVSGLDMSTEDFMNGNYELAADGTPGIVVNHGTIQAAAGGSVAMIGGQVTNTGLISAHYGRVTLAGAERAFLDFEGDGLLRVEITGELKQKLDDAEEAVKNSGTIDATGGRVILEAAATRGLFDNLVNNEGIIVATGIDTSGGEVRLVAVGGNVVNSGTIDVSSVAHEAGTVVMKATDGAVVNTGTIKATSEQASGGFVQLAAEGGNILHTGDIDAGSVVADGGFVEMTSNADTIIDSGQVDVGSVEATGGTIHVLGNRVAVVGPSRLGSAGGAGGGTVLVGGDFQGRNPLVRNASRTFIGPDAVIDVSALNSGSAGTVIVWSENYTSFFGTVSARGPPTGHGGFVEVSSHGTLAFMGYVDLRAGTNGTLLLDPTNVRICIGGEGDGCAGATDLDFSGGTFSDADNNGPSPSVLRVQDLVTQLGSGNVVVTTASSFGDAGNITVEDEIAWSTGNSLTLVANNNIIIAAADGNGSDAGGITASGAGSLTLTAGNTGSITVNADISLSGGSFTASAGSFSNSAGNTIAVAAGNISLTADEIDLGAAISGTGTLVLQPLTDGVSIDIGSPASGTGTLDLSDADLAALANGFTSITIGRATGTHVIVIGSSSFQDPVTIRTPSGGSIAVTGALAGTDNASLTLDGSGSTTTLSANVTTEGDAISISDAVVLGANVLISTTQNSQTAGAAIMIDGPGTIAGATFDLTLDGGTGGAISVAGAVSAVGALTITNSNGATFGSTVGATSITITDTTDNADVIFSGAVTAGSFVTTAQQYDVFFNGGGSFTSAVDFLNTGSLTLGNGGDSFSFDAGFTITGPTSLSLGASISTTNDALSLGALSLNADTTLSTGTATLSVAGISGGTFALVLEADEIQLTGAANSITGSGAVTLRPATPGQAIDVAGAGGTGALDLTATELATIQDGHSGITIGRSNGTGGITIGAVSFSDPITFLSPSGGTIAVNGAITGSDNASVTIDGSGATTILSADITTADDDIIISDSVQVAEAASVTLSTGTAGGGNISITGTVDGTAAGAAESLTLVSGSGTINVGDDAADDVGATTPLNLTLQSNNAGNTGAVTFAGTVNALSLTTFGQNYAVSLLDGGSITAAVTFLNTGALTLGNDAADSLTFVAGVTATAPSSRNIAGTIAANGTGVINFGTVNVTATTTVGGSSTGAITLGNATLADGATLTVGAGAATPINLAAISGTAGGAASNLTINTTAAVAVGGAIGTDLDTLTLTNSGGTTFSGNVSVATLTITDTNDAATVVFDGDLTVTTGMTVAANGAYLVTLQGTTTTVAGSTTFGNTGGVRFGNNSTNDVLTFTGGVTSTASTTALQSVVRTNGGAITLGAVVAQGTSPTLDSTNNGASAGGNDITIGAVTNSGATSLTLNAGNGAGSDISGTSVSGIDTLTITQADSVSFSGNVSTNTSVVLTDTNTSITFGGSLVTGTLTTAAQTYSVALNGGATITNAVTFSNTGSVQLGNDAGDTTTFNGGVTATAPSGLTLGGTIASSNDAIVLGDGNTAITLAANTTVDSNATTTAGDITLGAITGAGFNLTLETGGGVANADVTGTSISGVNALTFQNIGNASASTVTFNGSVSATSLSAGNTVNNVILNGTGGTITNAVAFDNNGTLTLGQSGGTQTYSGGVDTTGTNGTVTINGTIQTTNTALTLGAVTFGSPVTLAAGTSTVTAGVITAGANNFTITADEIDFGGGANSVTGSGTVVLQQGTVGESVGVGGGAGTLDISDTDIAALTDGFTSITIGRADGTGVMTVSSSTFADPVTLRMPGVGGDITITGALATTGNTGITLNAGDDISLGSTVTTGNVTVSTGGNDTATTGAISVTAGDAISGAGAFVTGNAASGGGANDTTTSGNITVTAGGTLALSGANALTTGTSAVGGANAGDTETVGSISISAASVSSNGTNGQLDVSIPTSGAGAGTRNEGALTVTTTGGAGDAGGIFITSGEALIVGALVTSGGSGQNVSISTSNVALTVINAAESLQGDTVTFSAGTGNFVISDSSFNVGAGNLTLMGNNIDIAGGNNSIIGTGTVTIQPVDPARAIEITTGTGNLDLQTSDIAALADGWDQIIIGRNDSTADTLIDTDVTFNDDVLLRGATITVDNTITGAAGVTVELVSRTGSIFSTAGTATNVNADIIILNAATNLGTDGGGTENFEVAGVEVLSITTGGNFDVVAEGATALTDLTISVDPAGTDTYSLTGFTNLQFTVTGNPATVNNMGITDNGTDLVVDGIAWTGTGALNITITTRTGNLVLNDNSDGAFAAGLNANDIAINLGTGGGNITLTSTLGDITDGDTTNGDNTLNANNVNLNTTSTSFITLTAGGGDAGTGTAGSSATDLDVAGTGNITCGVGTTCVVQTDTVGSLSLNGDPVDGTVDHSINAGGIMVDIDESCAPNAASCIHIVNITTLNFDFSYTGTTGDIYIDEGAITMNGGDVSITASQGGIYETTVGSAVEITTTGSLTLISFTATGTLLGAIDTSVSTLSATVTGDGTIPPTLDCGGGTVSCYGIPGNGGLYVAETGDVALGDIQTFDGDIVLSATGALTFASDDVNAGTNLVSLTAGTNVGTAGSPIAVVASNLVISTGTTFNVTTTSNLASLSITADQDIGATSDVVATGLTLSITSNGTNTTITDVTDTALDFSYTVLVGGDLIVNTINVGTSAVTLTANAAAGQEILDDEAVLGSTTRIVGGNVTLLANAGIGTATTNIDTTATTLSATVSAGGPININESDGLTEILLNAGTGNIFLVAGGSVLSADAAEDLIGAAATVSLSAGDFGDTDTAAGNAIETNVGELSVSTAGGNQFIRETSGLSELNLSAGAGDIDLFAGGAVLSADSAVDIAGDQAFVTLSTGDFGDTDTAAGNAIETDVAELSVNTSGANGNQFIRETSGLSELNLNAGTGNVSMLAGGAITSADAALDINGNVVAVTLSAGGFGSTNGTAGNAIEIAATDLAVNTSAGNGDQFILESDGLTAIDLNAGTGDILLVLTSGAVTDADGATDVTANELVVSAAGLGAAGNLIGTAIDVLEASTTTGGVHVTDAGGLTIGGAAVGGLTGVSSTSGSWDPLESTCRHASLSIL